jgi:hypothetical protein
MYPSLGSLPHILTLRYAASWGRLTSVAWVLHDDWNFWTYEVTNRKGVKWNGQRVALGESEEAERKHHLGDAGFSTLLTTSDKQPCRYDYRGSPGNLLFRLPVT